MKKSLIFILSLILAAMMFQAAHATEYYIPISGPIGYQEITAGTGAAVTLGTANIASVTNATSAGMARVYCSAYPVAFREDGTAPTSATIQTLAVGSFLYLHSITEMQNFQAIGLGGSAVLAVQYFILQRAN